MVTQDDRDILAMVHCLDYSLHTLDGLTVNLADWLSPDETEAAEIVKGAVVRIMTESMEALDPDARGAISRCGFR